MDIRIRKTALALVLAATTSVSALSVSAPAHANAQFASLIKEGIIEHGPCLAFNDKINPNAELNTSNSAADNPVANALNDGASKLWNMARGFMKKSPYCEVTDPVDKLLLMSSSLDQATFLIAKGLDDAQKALGIRRTLDEDVVAMEDSLNGASLAEQVGSQRRAWAKNTSKAGQAVIAELERLKASGGISDELQGQLLEVHYSMSRGSYFKNMAGAGAFEFQRMIRNEAARNYLAAKALTDPRIGGKEGFLLQVPKHAVNVVENIFNALKALDAVKTASSDKAQRKIKRQAKKAKKESRKQAISIAERIRSQNPG